MSAPDAHHDPHRFDDGRPHVNNANHGSANGHVNGHANGHKNGSSNRQNLSEISHLFLSDLRALNSSGRTPPKRTPPGAQEPASPRHDETIDLTPDEFGELPEGESADDRTPVAAVIGARLEGTLIRRVCQYAASLGADRPVGLVVVEATGLRLLCVSNDASELPDEQDASPLVVSSADRLHEAMLEMGCDIDRWLVVLPDPRLPHARRLLAMIPDWVLLTVAKHEGVVAGYRALKGLCDLPRLDLDDESTATPHITLALLDAESEAEAQKHARKLIGVCKQFLDLEMSADISADSGADEASSTGSAASVGEFVVQEVVTASWPDVRGAAQAWPVLEAVLVGEEDDADPGDGPATSHRDRSDANESKTYSPNGEIAMFQDSRQDHLSESQPSRTSQARVDDAFIPPVARPAPARPTTAPRSAADAWVGSSQEQAEARRRLADAIDVPEMARPAGKAGESAAAGTQGATVGPRFPQAQAEEFVGRVDHQPRSVSAVPSFPTMAAPETSRHDDEVIDLPAGASVAEVVLARLDVATTPLVPPMLAGGRLCVDRSGGLVLIAGAAPGLTDLAAIGRAMTWVTENRQLIGMALAQYRIADAGDVRLHLLVSHTDANADALRPLLGTGRVLVQSYRRLTWAGRCGVLLEAA